MRFSDTLALTATCLVMNSCMGGDSSLLGPADPGDDPGLSPAAGGEMRIVEPRNGAFVSANQDFALRVRQELRGEPTEGRAQLQYSYDSQEWNDLGAPFPWTRQSREFTTPSIALEEAGAVSLRLIVYDARSREPSLESYPVSVQCREANQLELASNR